MAGLSLTVKVGQSVFINGDIRVEVIAVHTKNAVIRFIAPSDVRVLRESLVEKGAGGVAGSGSVSVSDSAAG